MIAARRYGPGSQVWFYDLVELVMGRERACHLFPTGDETV
ncbi:MAG: hypothetical protein ACI8Y4_005605, partial [Candidatus Poriferisodalaceae bacterium]